MVRFSADGYATAEHAMIECAGGNFPAGAIPMQRRTFLGVTAGARAALASKPLALAEEQERKNPVLYPDPAVEVIDPRFAKVKVINGAVERLYVGTRWAEGPVWFRDGRYLLFSDIPNNRMLRWLEETER
jgi:gluconolactonase